MIYLNDRLDRLDLDAALERMPVWRREITLRYTSPALQRQSAAAFALLQEALQREYGITAHIEFATAVNNKPTLLNHPHIHFNLSHCRAAAICAVGSLPVGIDIEIIRHQSDALVAYVMNPAEQEQIARADNPDLEFTRLWTSKEAVAKQSGHGLQSSEQIKNLLIAPHPPVVTYTDSGQRYVWSVCSSEKFEHITL